jgi:hydrogenase nickel incorporation protein HypB
MKIDLAGKVRSANDDIATSLREKFAEKGLFVFNMISAPGSGKTALLGETGKRLGGRVPFAVIVGDVETQADADRLRDVGLSAHQIETFGSCHLDAKMIEKALESFPVSGPGLLAIENIGNLVCPVSFDLGENVKVSLVSVTEGADKPSKYPAAFAKASVFIVTKIDLAPYVDCDVDRLVSDALAINPDLKVFRLSSKTGEGMDEWVAWLSERTRTQDKGS